MSNIGDVSYNFLRLMAILVVFIGLVHYHGKLSKEKYVLKKYGRFETNLKNYAAGLIITVTLLFIFLAFIAGLINKSFPPKITTLEIAVVSIWVLIGTFLYLSFFERIQQQVPIFPSVLYGLFASEIMLLCIFIPFFILRKHPEYIPILIVISVLLLICCILGYPYHRGRSAPHKIHMVSIDLEAGEALNGLSLYQTTDVDYRFVKQDEKGEIQKEVVIPISNVKKIVYEDPGESVSSKKNEENNSEDQGDK